MKRYILLPLLAVGCLNWTRPDDGNHYHLYIAPGFSDSQHEMVVKAAQNWAKATDGFITFDLNAWTADSSNTISVYPTTLKQLDEHESTLGETWNYRENSKIEDAIDLDTDTFRRTALHEMGHALGLVHNPDTGNKIANGFMCANNGCASEQIECVDLKQLCAVWGGFCDADSMAPCQK